MWQTRPIPKITASSAPAALRSAIRAAYSGSRSGVANDRCSAGTAEARASERAVEGRLHRRPERAGMVAGQGLAVAVAPLVHVEPVDVVARSLPLGRGSKPPSGTSPSGRRGGSRRAGAVVAGLADRVGDFVPEHHVEVGDRCARFRARRRDATRAGGRGSPRAGGRSRRRPGRGPSLAGGTLPSSTLPASSAGSWSPLVREVGWLHQRGSIPISRLAKLLPPAKHLRLEPRSQPAVLSPKDGVCCRCGTNPSSRS